MQSRRSEGRRRARRLLAGGVVAAGALAATAVPAQAATTASFSDGTLSVVGDSLDNNIQISRNAAGTILVNGGAVNVTGGVPSVANTSKIKVFGEGGNDTIALNETSGALPAAQLSGAAGNDTLTGGSGADQVFGQAGNDTLLGKGSNDLLFGGTENDTITGGDADDQAFGQSGEDRMIWNPGDDTDLNEGGVNSDTVEVNGAGAAEQFTTTANGTRVRLDRVNPAPFAIDIGTSENLVLNANGGDDSHSATGNLLALIKITVDGGAGNDSLLGSNGIDLLIGGDGEDFVDGQQGNDVAFLGANDDTFQWDPGDGNDIVEGQAGSDEMLFNGSGGDEIMEASAVGQRVRFTRSLGSVVMDLDDVESIRARMLGGIDRLAVGDLSGTAVVGLVGELAAAGGGNDVAADTVVATATNGDDAVIVSGSGPNAQASGLSALVSVTGAVAGSDRLTVNALAGDDVVDASGLEATAALLSIDGGLGDDVLIGGDGPDTILGGDGDDVLIGGPGLDTLDGQADDNVVIQIASGNDVSSATVVRSKWLKSHARVNAKGKTVLKFRGEKRKLPRADLARLVRDVRAA